MWRLAEEASEVIKALSKIHRFGWNPTDKRTGLTYDNLDDLMNELYDFRHAETDLKKALGEKVFDV